MNLFRFIGSPNPLFNWDRSSAGQKEPPVTNFESIFFNVEPGKVYYLGDISINAYVKHESINIKTGKFLLEIIYILSSSNEQHIITFISRLNITPNMHSINLSYNWKKNFIDLNYKQTQKQYSLTMHSVSSGELQPYVNPMT